MRKQRARSSRTVVVRRFHRGVPNLRGTFSEIFDNVRRSVPLSFPVMTNSLRDNLSWVQTLNNFSLIHIFNSEVEKIRLASTTIHELLSFAQDTHVDSGRIRDSVMLLLEYR